MSAGGARDVAAKRGAECGIHYTLRDFVPNKGGSHAGYWALEPFPLSSQVDKTAGISAYALGSRRFGILATSSLFRFGVPLRYISWLNDRSRKIVPGTALTLVNQSHLGELCHTATNCLPRAQIRCSFPQPIVSENAHHAKGGDRAHSTHLTPRYISSQLIVTRFLTGGTDDEI
jgi:hypothetical protein